MSVPGVNRGHLARELTRELARLVGRERTRAFIERTVDAAKVDLPPGEAWLLVQAAEGRLPLDDPEAVAEGRPFDTTRAEAFIAGLAVRGLVSDAALTDAGRATAARLIGARHDCLHSLIADWKPDDDERINDAVARLARELAGEVPALQSPR